MCFLTHTRRWAESILPAADGDGCLTMTRTSWAEECCISSAGSKRDREVNLTLTPNLTIALTLNLTFFFLTITETLTLIPTLSVSGGSNSCAPSSSRV